MKYMGGKRRIAPYISQYINDIATCYNITEYYEPFMGGCAVGELVRINNRYLSDINKYIVAMFQKAQESVWEFKYITRDEWYDIKYNMGTDKYPDWLTGWASIAASFRGRPFEGYAGDYEDSITHKIVSPQQQVYNSLLQEIPNLKGITFSNISYNQINPTNAIIYCDAPYRGGVKQYDRTEVFDFDAYDEWLIKQSKNNIVLISEYTMQGKLEDKFIELESWTLNKNIGAGNVENETSVEKLYYIKDGYLTKDCFETDLEVF